MRTTTITTLAITAALLTACSSNPPAAKPTPSNTWPGGLSPAPKQTDTASRLIDWADNGGQTDLSAISDDLDPVQKDLQQSDIDGLVNTCAKLTADIETAQAGDPPPDKTARHHWEKALEHYGKAASACTLGAASEDSTTLNQMGGELTIGTEHMGKFNDRFDEVGESTGSGA